jgi:hypothetical protein
MNNLITHLQGFATGKIVLGFFIPAVSIYLLMMLYTIPQVMQYAPEMKLFDMSPTGYSFVYANDLLKALGVEGRGAYLYLQLPVDFIYPGLFAVSCCLLLTWLFSKSINANSKMFYLCFVPVLAGLFDYFENICIVNMLISYPDITQTHVSTSSGFTILKSALTTAFFIVLMLGVVLLLKSKWTEKIQSKGKS